MENLNITIANSEEDLKGIIDLQSRNHSGSLSLDEIQSQGFITVRHSLENLKNLSALEPQIICKDGDTVVAYILAMTSNSEKELPLLFSMFELFKRINFKNKPIAMHNYLVVGQVCVDRAYRSQGVLDKCYEVYKNSFVDRYDFAVTEVASRNLRSIAAHKRNKFIPIHTYISPEGEEWQVVIWDWK